MEKIINIGKSNTKFKRILETNLTKDNLQNVVFATMESLDKNPMYSNDSIIKYSNLINTYFESGKFYNDFYGSLTKAIKENNCERIDDNETGAWEFLYEIKFTPIHFQDKIDKFLLTLLSRYIIGVYKEGGFKAYLLDTISYINLYIQYFEITQEIETNEISFNFHLSVFDGPLYKKLVSYYQMLTNK